MRTLLLFILALTLSSTASAQTPLSSDVLAGAETNMKRSFSKIISQYQQGDQQGDQQAARPNDHNFKLSYFDQTLPTFSWVAPAVYGDYVLIDLGQRFTLPAERGFVDSVRIYFDT